ncbi:MULTISPECIES: nickel/cobalt transporter [Halomonas]|uniref:nickel/cobalt transporter n=1 Tax=Halomonas TaxID=2745 RepID=UPI001CD3ADC7|nr:MULTISPECIES: sodium:proton antiporter [Halomonas]MCA0918198.1 sodium:proton antiporter [Halomonas denitrificans]
MLKLQQPWVQVSLAVGAVAGVLLLLAVTGALDTLGHWVLAMQADLHRRLTQAVTLIDQTPSAAAWATLIGLSLFYGVFHAAGPGHGKAVISAYLVSQGGAWRRALALSVGAALMQGAVAILLILALVQGLGWLTREALGSVVWVERLSFALVALLGLWLSGRALKRLVSLSRPAQQSAGSEHHGAHHHEPHHIEAHHHEHPSHGHHAHGSHHDHHECCGGHHHVSPDGSGREAWLAVLAIGARPCSGAVLLMGVTSLLGQPWMGVAAVLAMSLGTAMTVSTLGIASVLARDWVSARVARTSATRSRAVARLAAMVALAGGVLIIGLGVLLMLQVGASDPGLPLMAPGSRSGGLGV